MIAPLAGSIMCPWYRRWDWNSNGCAAFSGEGGQLWKRAEAIAIARDPDILMMLMPPVQAGVAMAAIVESYMKPAAAQRSEKRSFNRRT
jgi:hypothetical protein